MNGNTRHRRTLLTVAATVGVAALWASVATADAPTTAPASSAAPAVDRYALGWQTLARLDPAAPQRTVDAYAGLAPAFARHVIEHAFGDVYARPQLDARTRLLAAVAALTAVGDSAEPLGLHVRYALNAGCTPDEIVETIVQTSVYAGFPRSVKGLAVAREVFNDRNVATTPDRTTPGATTRPAR